jgi:hypothetical protein
MQQRTQQPLTWSALLTALSASEGDVVIIRDGTNRVPSGLVGTRAAAKGTEFYLGTDSQPVARKALIDQLEALSKSPGRRFMTSARVQVDGTNLLVESVADESPAAVIVTRRPKLGFNPSHQTGASTTFRNKRIKTG